MHALEASANISSSTLSNSLFESQISPSNSGPLIKREALYKYCPSLPNKFETFEQILKSCNKILQAARKARIGALERGEKEFSFTLSRIKNSASVIDFLSNQLRFRFITKTEENCIKIKIETPVQSSYLQDFQKCGIKTPKYAPHSERTNLERSRLEFFGPEENPQQSLQEAINSFFPSQCTTSSSLEQCTDTVSKIFEKLASQHLEQQTCSAFMWIAQENYESIVAFFAKVLDYKIATVKGSTGRPTVRNYIPYTVTVDTDNPFLKPARSKPVMPQESSFSIKVENQDAYSNVTFIVNGAPIKGDKMLFAAACDLFELWFSGEFGKKDEFPFNGCDARAFSELKNFIYRKEFSPGYIDEVENCLEMFHLACLVNCNSLRDLSRKILAEKIDENNFWEIACAAVEKGDVHLIKLAQWYIGKSPSLEETVDLSQLSMNNMIVLLELAVSCDLPRLKSTIVSQLKSFTKLDGSFVSACDRVLQAKNSDITAVFVEGLKANPILLTSLRANKEGAEWKAYVEVCTAD